MFSYLFILLSSISFANPSAIFGEVELGISKQAVKRTLERRRIKYQTKTFSDPQGLAFGLLQSPGMLAMMNRHAVKNTFFDDLPASGPLFYRALSRGHTGIFAFKEGRLETYLVAIAREVIKPSRDPFSPTRLAKLTNILSSLQNHCRSFAPTNKDQYGNVKSWSGKGCRHGGGVKVDLHPGEANTLVVLYHR